MDCDRTVFDKRFIFSYTSAAWDKLLPHWNQPLIKKDNEIHAKSYILIANACKKAVLAVAFAIITLATGIFSLLTYPYRCYRYSYEIKYTWTPEKELIALNQEINKKEINTIKNEIELYIDSLNNSHPDTSNLSLKDKCRMISHVASSYVRSKKIYGPVVRLWVEHLLQRANTNQRKLVFMARDGIPPYLVAKELMKKKEYQEKYPNLVGEKQIVLGYFSRKLIANAKKNEENTKLLQEYLTDELGIRAGDACLFVDLGFEGSMVEPIRELAQPIILPNDCDAKEMSDDDSLNHPSMKELFQFEFLISIRSDRASGFLASEHRQLQSVPFAGGNIGVHWLEDSHQGNVKSPNALIKCARDGHIYPNVLEPGNEQLEEPKGSFQQVLREFNQRAIMDCVEMPLPEQEIEIFLLKKRMTLLFDTTLQLIKDFRLPLYMRHV